MDDINNLERLIRDEFTLTRNTISEQFEKLKEVLSSLQLSKDGQFEVDDQNPFNIYKGGHIIGKGTFGEVYEVYKRETKEPLAMKILALDDANILSPSFAREISTLFDLNHENIVKIENVHLHGSHVYLMMEFVKRDLNMAIQEGYNDPETVKAWLRSLLCAVDFIHKRGIIHRDIKPENILIDANQKLKLADLGSVKGFIDDAELSPNVTTLPFRALEVLMGSTSYGRPIDIWAIGCVFFEMVEGKPLFGREGKESSEISVIDEIFRKLGTPSAESRLRLLPNFPKDVSPSPAPAATELTSKLDKHGNDLMLKLLAVDPEDRICAEDALKHPYFSFGAY